MKIWIALERVRRRRLAHKEYLAASPWLEYEKFQYFRENLLSLSTFEKILKIVLCFTFPLFFATFFLALYLHNYFLGILAIASLFGTIGKEIQYFGKLKKIAFKDKGKFRPLYPNSVTSRMLQKIPKFSDVRLEFPKMPGRAFSYRKNQFGYVLELGTKGLLAINEYKVNSFGDRGVPDVDPRRGDEHYSIVCYGDSYSDLLGNGQNEEDYPSVEWPYYLLEQITSKGLRSFSHETFFDVQNCSKCGIGLLQMLDNAEEYLQEFVSESSCTKNIMILVFISTDISRLPFSIFEYYLGGNSWALCHEMMGGYTRASDIFSTPININSYQKVLNHGGWSSELDEFVHLGKKALSLDRLMYIRPATLPPNWLFESITGAPFHEKSQLEFTSHQPKPKMSFDEAKDFLLGSEANWEHLKKLADLQRLFILHCPVADEVQARSYKITSVDDKVLKLLSSLFPSSLFRIPIDSIRDHHTLLSRTPWDHHPSKVLMKHIANYAYALLNSKILH